METLQQDGPVKPLLVFGANGDLLDAVLQNDKARNKTLEQKQLWVVDGSTGRVLPWHRGGTWESYRKDGPCDAAVVSNLLPPSHDQASPSSPQDSRSVTASSADAPHAQLRPDSNFLYELESLIRTRKHEMPEGSYTTHLFKNGISKIRKKTGEEAVELILADSPDTVASEASDLLYHMMVLLVESGVSWSTVMGVLQKR